MENITILRVLNRCTVILPQFHCQHAEYLLDTENWYVQLRLLSKYSVIKRISIMLMHNVFMGGLIHKANSCVLTIYHRWNIASRDSSSYDRNMMAIKLGKMKFTLADVDLC